MMSLLLYKMQNIFFIFIGLCGIGFLIGFHEFGHFLFARLFGVRAPSFSIGMGPKIFSKTIAGTEFKLSAIPLGGYVEIAGLAEIGQGDQKESLARDKGSFQVKPYWQKLLIMSGGIIFNLFLAFLIFIGLYITGMPQTLISAPEQVPPTIVRIQEDSVAEKINLQPGDSIISINKVSTPTVLDVIKFVQKNKGNTITITVNRNGKNIQKAGILDQTGRLGIEYKIAHEKRYSFIESVRKAWNMMLLITKKTFDVFFNLFKSRTMNGVGGPLLIISQMVANAKQGAGIFFFLLAFISINLAVMNLIPLPITDGGQIVFITIESIIRRQIPEKIRLVIHNISWMLIMALAIYLTIKDSIMLFWPTIKSYFM